LTKAINQHIIGIYQQTKGSETMTEAQERTLKLLKETYPHMTEREEYYLDATVMALAAVCRKREGLESAGERTA
jgi:hypothetical protein